VNWDAPSSRRSCLVGCRAGVGIEVVVVGNGSFVYGIA